MKYFDLQGYFPDNSNNIPLVVRDYIASQLSEKVSKLKDYDCSGRSSQIHNSEIRQYYGYRKIDRSDFEQIKSFIENNLLTQGLPRVQVYDETGKLLRKLKIEPLSHKELQKFVNSICTEYEVEFFKECNQELTADSKLQLLELFASYEDDQAVLSFIRKPAGKVSTVTINTELEKLGYLAKTKVLYTRYFANIPRKLLKKYYDRVSISTPSALLYIKQADESKFHGLLACFCKYKASRIIDNLTEIFIRRFKKIEKLAKSKAKEDLWEYCVTEDRDKLLHSLVDISLEYPDGVIKQKIYPSVGGREKLEQSKLSRHSLKYACKELEYKHLSFLYVHHHREPIFLTLKNLRLKANTTNLVLEAINFIIENLDNKDFQSVYYPANYAVVTKDIIAKLDLQVIRTKEGKINRIYYELAILSLLRKELRCKSIWVESSLKYNYPDKELPQDFKEKKTAYCQMLNLSENAQEEILRLKRSMLKNTQEFNATVLNNPDVRIGIKANKSHILITPYDAQIKPVNLDMLKNEVAFLWPNLSLLDIFKETDLRINLTSELIDIVGKTSLDHNLLQQRLLVCLFAIATNTEFKKICSGISNISEADLYYVKKRFITPEGLRYIIKKLINNTLAIRDKKIWGEIINSSASDSTKFEVWSENLMSEYYIRYQGNGIMAYWHLEKKALCIASQIIRCSSSEIAAMLEGVIHHATNAKVENHSTDTHGQSLIAFAFAHLLSIDLRPRIKGIGRLKLYKADPNIAKSDYCNIEAVMTRPINWKLIFENYDEMLKYLVALKLRTTEPEVLLKRRIADNSKSPVYKAFLELGRAVRTSYICGYSTSKASNDEIDQETSILALHLLQSLIVYINTLMLQKVLKTEEWQQRLTLEDKRALTPLFYNHINQCGIYKLDMNERIKIDEA